MQSLNTNNERILKPFNERLSQWILDAEYSKYLKSNKGHNEKMMAVIENGIKQSIEVISGTSLFGFADNATGVLNLILGQAYFIVL